MKRSDSLKELAGALSKAQGVLTAPVKDKLNPHFKSTYAGLASYIEAVSKTLSEHGMCFTQTTEYREGQTFSVTTLIHASSDQWISAELPLILSKNDMPTMIAGLTYARRALLGGIVGVFQDDPQDQEALDNDDDGVGVSIGKPKRLTPAAGESFFAYGKALPPEKPNGKILPLSIQKYIEAFREVGVSDKDIMNAFRIDSLSMLTEIEIKILKAIGQQMKGANMIGAQKFLELVSKQNLS